MTTTKATIKSYKKGDLYNLVTRRLDKLTNYKGKPVGHPLASSLRRLAMPVGDGKTLALSDPGNAGVVDVGDGLLAVDEKTMSAGFVVSSTRRDRHGDVVVPAGCKDWLDDYTKNPVVFFAHKSDCLPIASARSPKGELALWLSEDTITSRAYFHGKTKESEEVFDLVAAGHLRAASIGFIPVEGQVIPPENEEPVDDQGNIDFDLGGVVFTKWQMLEWSVVPVPANADALRARLQSSKSLSPFLRKSLEPFASPLRNDRPRFATPLRKNMNSSALADDLTKPAEQPGSDEKEVTCDAQALVFHPDRFHDDATVKQWLEDNGYADAEVHPGEEGDEPWIAIIFPAEECEVDSASREEIEDGVELVTCTRKKAQHEEPDGDEAVPAGEGQDMKNLKSDVETPGEKKPGEMKPGEVKPGDESPDKGKPYGAQVLLDVKGHLDACCKYLEKAVATLEQAKVQKWAAKYMESMLKTMEEIDSFGASQYPDVFKAEGKKTKPDAEEPDEDDSEEEDKKKSLSPRRPVVSVKAAVARKDVSVLQDTSEFLKELAGEDNLKRSQKAACRLHAGDMDSLCQKYSEPAEDDTPTARKDAGEDPRLVEAVNQLLERYYELTGEEL